MSVVVARPLPQRRLTGQRQQLVATAHVRLMMLMLLFAAAITVLLGRLVFFAVFVEPDAINRSGASLLETRGDIVDRNGAPMARTIEAWAIGVQPDKVLGDKHELAETLATLMPDHDAAYYYGQITRPVSFTYLQHHASPAIVNEVHAIGEPGIVFHKVSERLYPQATMAAHALGFLSFGGHGLRGMERVLDERLNNSAMNAGPVALSIDTRVQAAMESELGGAMASFKARGAAGIVLDVHTGEVISMVSLPLFNPNRLKRMSEEELRNNVTQSVYELGSTFKPITMAAAIDDGVVTSMSKRFDATEPLKVGRFTIKDDHPQRRFLNIPETLVHSSNIATARIADELGKDRMQAMFRSLGFDAKPDIELVEKTKPLWPTYWAETTTMTTGYGHGIAVTPLHLANAYAALVNGGIWRPATLLKVAPGEAPKGRRIISQATSDRMRQLLRLVVLQGTGRKGEAPGYRVGGKTGTAEIAQGGGYNKRANVSTFAAVFPMDAPRYVVIAMLDSPVANAQSAGQTTAAWTVAPVVSHVITRTGAMLGVIPDDHRDIDVSELLPLLWHAPGENSEDPE